MVVLYPSQKEKLLFDSNEVSMIRIKFKSINPHLFSFTELNHELNKQVYYMSNRSVYRSKKHIEYKLHAGDFLGAGHLAHICTPNTSLQAILAETEGTLKSLNNNNEYVFKPNLYPTALSLLQDNFGVFKIEKQDVKFEQTIIYEQEASSRVFAICDLFISSNYLLSASEEPKRKFTINLKNREVLWRYYFVHQHQTSFSEHIKIYNGKKKLEIQELTQVILINNKQATRVTLSKEIALVNTYNNVKLLATIDQNPEISESKSIKLPTPALEKLTAFKDLKGSPLGVEMYVSVK